MSDPVDLNILPEQRAKLMARLDKNSMPEPNTGCRFWLRATDRFGYGSMGVNGHNRLAHRVAYTIFIGQIPRRMRVLHRCDEPSCIEPSHFFIGTLDDNNKDRNAKGRTARGDRSGPHLHPESYRGERCGHAKLTEAKVRALRARAAAGESWRQLARAFGISKRQAGNVIHRLSWGHV